ncbi:Coagulation factor XIII B chain [Oryzias melastigma]|uniref:Coagulation factor XIII B chain n=1 Tax=Oryzias melastigma TaxID=30732 RepID=A0A834F4Z1_ORYME|nr:Coagulation factor XIII B chain [Oryzias melastigma]
MWFLRVLLLAWFPGVLHAQTAAGSCARPDLTGGFLVSDQQSYPHESNVAYACNDGLKSAMDGWWGTSTCKDGKWFPDIFCIDERSCVPPEIPHVKYSTTTGWFKENDKLRVECDQGYRLKNPRPNYLPQCIKGSWDLTPVCESEADACDQPPQIANATIIHEATQKVFATGFQLGYICKDGHSLEEGSSKGLITCESGEWTMAPPCTQGTPQVCSAPNLENGYIVPMKGSYQQNEKITYACEDGYKPAVEGWWAESTCGNGQWSPQPLCIEKSACIPPTVINEKYEEESKLWYKNGDKKRITCNEGYDNKDYVATALCERGNWTIVPVCEKSKVACSEPPKIPYAVIINREHQEVFPVNSNVTYQCKDDYVTEEGAKIKSVFCTSGNWTTTPTCSYFNVLFFSVVENCGELPVVANGLVQQSENLALRVSCQMFYKLDGPEKVVCYSSNKWSEVPICKVNYCAVDTAAYEDDSYQLNEKIIYACDYEFKPAVDVAQSICENGQWSPQPQCIAHETPQFCSAPNVENGYFVPIKESYQLNEIIIYACENGFKPAVDAIHSMCENGQWSPQPQCIVYSPGLIEGNTKPEVVPVENCGELPVVANGLVQQSENLALRVSCQMFYKLDGPEKVVCYSSNKWSEVPVCKVNYCAVDTAAYEDVIPDGVKYVVNGERMELKCIEIFFHESHRVVRCRNGKVTVSESNYCSVDTAAYEDLIPNGVKYVLLVSNSQEHTVAGQPTVGGTSETAEGAALGGASLLPSVPEGAPRKRRCSLTPGGVRHHAATQ